MEKLEEIFWKEGKFLNKQDKPVKAESIGKPIIVYNHERNSPENTRNVLTLKVLDLQEKDVKYSKVNGYCLGEKAPLLPGNWENERNTSVQLYKISF